MMISSGLAVTARAKTGRNLWTNLTVARNGRGKNKMLYFHMWSGGKDSTASVILDHIHRLPPSTIIFSEVMFDKKRGISGELPEHIDFVKNKAKPVFENWGYKVEIVRAEKDYLDIFFTQLSIRLTRKETGK